MQKHGFITIEDSFGKVFIKIDDSKGKPHLQGTPSLMIHTIC